MTKSFVSAAAAEATSVAMPTHQAGDLLVMWAYRASSTTRVVAPAGWWYVTMRANVVQSATLCYKIATSSSEVSGTWTNAEMLAVSVYRDDVNYLILGGFNPISAAATTNVQFPLIAAPSAQVTGTNTMRGGSSWVLGAVGVVANNSDIETPPAGMVNRVNLAGAGTNEVSIHDTDGDVASWPATSHTQSVSAAYHAAVAEIVDTGVPKASSNSFGYIIGS